MKDCKINLQKDVRDSLQFKLGNVARQVFRKMNSELSVEGIPVLAEQMPILMVVYFKESDMTQQDIANVLQKDKAGIQRSVQSLNKDGFLKIESDIVDKRKNLISLTASGRYVCEKVQALMMKFNNQIMENFSEQESKLFLSFLDRVASVFEK